MNLVQNSVSTNNTKSKESFFIFAVDSKLGQADRKLDIGLEVKADMVSRKKGIDSTDPPLDAPFSPGRVGKKLSIWPLEGLFPTYASLWLKL